MVEFVGANGARPGGHQLPVGDRPFRRHDPGLSERFSDTTPHFGLVFRLGGKEHPQMHVPVPPSGSVVRSERTGRVMVPSPAQRKRDRRTRCPQIILGIHRHDGIMRKDLAHDERL
jgi:hypothetical protein